MRKARVRSPQYSRFLIAPPCSAMSAVSVSASVSTWVDEMSWRAMTVVSYNGMGLRLLLAIHDPTLVDARRQPLGSSRVVPGKEQGRAIYRKRSAAQARQNPGPKGTDA